MPSFVPVSVAFVSDLNHPVQMFRKPKNSVTALF